MAARPVFVSQEDKGKQKRKTNEKKKRRKKMKRELSESHGCEAFIRKPDIK